MATVRPSEKIRSEDTLRFIVWDPIMEMMCDVDGFILLAVLVEKHVGIQVTYENTSECDQPNNAWLNPRRQLRHASKITSIEKK